MNKGEGLKESGYFRQSAKHSAATIQLAEEEITSLKDKGSQRNSTENLFESNSKRTTLADTNTRGEEVENNSSCCCSLPTESKRGQQLESGRRRNRRKYPEVAASIQEVQKLWQRATHYSACLQNNNNTNNYSSHEESKGKDCPKTRSAESCCCKKGATKVNMSTKNQTTRLIPAYFIAELVGTFLLVVIGDGAVAAYVLTKRPVDVFCVCFAFGVGAMIASFASARISGAHINPAASLAFALDGRLKWRLLPIYLLAQYIGGFLAALVLFLNYSEAINSIDGGQHSANGAANSTGGVFATYPAPYVTIWGSLLDQIVGTAVLLFSISAVTDRSNHGLEDKHQPLCVAFVIGIICVAFSPNCGAIFNPARDLPPRLVTAIFGYPAVWAPLNGTYWLLAGVVGPHAGAIIGVFAYKFTIGYALSAHRNHMQQQAYHDQEDKQQRLTTSLTTTNRQ